MTTQGLTQLHLGLGSFHRAHQAVYLQHLIEQGDDRWQIVGGNIRPDMAETLQAIKDQGGYTLETVNSKGVRNYQWIESIRDVIAFDSELAGLAAVAANPNTRIISFTVTEAGYYLDLHDDLDITIDDIASDLAGSSRCTIYGALAHLLNERRLADAGAVTLLNCDNLRSNGKRFYAGFKQFLQHLGNAELVAWVEQNTCAPDSMVDRITPRPTAEVAERVKAATGRDDGAALMGETFIQWVVEDHFINGRPAWEKVGAEMVSDVMPYEEAKIRLLNATHSCIAWAGTLKGYNYIHEGSLDNTVCQLAHDYVTHCAIPCLTPSPLKLDDYRDVVLDRFSNPNIQDTNQRVAMDGYSKIPGFILPTIRECLSGGRSLDAVALVVALFLRFLQYRDEGQLSYEYQDQAMDPESLERILNADDPVAQFCSEALLFEELAGDSSLIDSVRRGYQTVCQQFFG